MSTMKGAFASLVQSLDEDHWQIALALQGLPASLPRDGELAGLFVAILSAPLPCTLLDVAEAHPAAAFLHVLWVAEARPRKVAAAPRRRPELQNQSLLLAS